MKTLLIISIVLLASCEYNLELSTDNTFTDVRDGRTYETVQIGDMVWMAENLDYIPVYGADSAIYTRTDKYGVFYNYYALEGISPEGWHIPTDDEWSRLTYILGGDSIAGSALYDVGFNPLLSGLMQSSYQNEGGIGGWWSLTECFNDYAWIRYINHTSDYILTTNLLKSRGCCVRCVKNIDN